MKTKLIPPLLILCLAPLVLLAAEKLTMSQRTLRMDNFPCTECHDLITATPKSVDKSQLSAPHFRLQFKHMDNLNDCYFCHNKADMNTLVLLTDEVVSFNNSYRTCTQCHGEKGQDFLLGIHGKQVGKWNGEKIRSNCADCHDPHKPAFKKMKPSDAPKRPKFGIDKGAHHG